MRLSEKIRGVSTSSSTDFMVMGMQIRKIQENIDPRGFEKTWSTLCTDHLIRSKVNF